MNRNPMFSGLMRGLSPKFFTILASVAAFSDASAQNWAGFERGMGMGGWLTNYKRFNVLPVEKRMTLTQGDYEHFDSYITEADIERVKLWGFDHIRLGFDQIVVEEVPGKYRERTFRKIDEFIGWCMKHKLNVVLNLHKAIGNYCDIDEKVQLLDDDALQRRFVNLWLEVERRYHGFPGLAFEILNEVRDVNPEKWNCLADRTIKAIREKNPDRWIVIGSACWNSPSRLIDLKVWEDPHVVYTFHMYDPHGFTHQRGVLQAGPLFENRDVPYPGRASVERSLKSAADWLKAHPDKILWCGEFGTIRHMQMIDRVSFMRDVVRFCRANAMPYCVWNYLSTPNDGNRFSLVDDDTRDFLSRPLLDACLGRGDREARGEFKYLAFDFKGPDSGRPVCEHDLRIAKHLIYEEPDLIGFQNCDSEFLNSRLFPRLYKAGYAAIRNVLLYRKDRLELVEEAGEGFVCGVFRDKSSGKLLLSCSNPSAWTATQTETVAALKDKYGTSPGLEFHDFSATSAGHGRARDQL